MRPIPYIRFFATALIRYFYGTPRSPTARLPALIIIERNFVRQKNNYATNLYMVPGSCM